MNYKKVLYKICVFIFSLSLVIPNVLAAGELEFQLSAPSEINPGEQFALNVSVNVSGITDGKVNIFYDNSTLEFQSGNLLYSSSQQSQFVINSNEPGKLVIVWATIDEMQRPGDLFSLTFRAKESLQGNSVGIRLHADYTNNAQGQSLNMGVQGSQDQVNIGIAGSGNKPTEPETPVDPGNKPTEPENPSNPGNKPTQPENPANPGNKPNTPGTPQQPGSSNTPSQGSGNPSGAGSNQGNAQIPGGVASNGGSGSVSNSSGAHNQGNSDMITTANTFIKSNGFIFIILGISLVIVLGLGIYVIDRKRKGE